jgi:hypothetical protein
MLKKIHDIVSLKIILLFLSITFFAECRAQPELQDTVVVADTMMATTNASYFDKMPEESMPVARTVPDSTMKKIRKDDAYWYANLAPKKKKEPEPPKEGKSLFEQGWIKSLVWIIMIVTFIGVVLWYLAAGNISLFRKKSVPIVSEAEALAAEDIFALDYTREIDKAIAEKNYRLATRLLYLRTLKSLSDRGFIEYTHERTNSDYLSQLSGSNHYRPFFRLTREFDYTWYGKFELSADAFAVVQNDFNTFNEQLRS